MKTKKFLFLISVVIIFIIMFNCNISYASDIGDIITGADTFVDTGKFLDTGDSGLDTVALGDASDTIYKILMVLGIGIAVIVSVVLGIKFMIGSVEEKAQVKDALIPFVIGCIVIFGAFSIWGIVVKIGNKL